MISFLPFEVVVPKQQTPTYYRNTDPRGPKKRRIWILVANLPGVNKDSNLEQEEETGADKDDVEQDIDLLYPEEYAVLQSLASGS